MIFREIYPGVVGYSDIFNDCMSYVSDYEIVHKERRQIWFEEGTNSPGNKTPEYQPSVRSTLVTALNTSDINSPIERLSRAAQLSSRLDEVRDACLEHYKTLYGDMDIRKKEGWALLKYRPGDFFNNHTDSSHEYPRQISLVFYFNNNYTGGELSFPFIDLKIKPLAGELIMFPSNYLFVHSANKIESGVKYSAISFMN